MRICVVVPAHWEGLFGGSQFQARGLVDQLAEDGHEVYYLAYYVRPGYVGKNHTVVPLWGWQKSRVFDAVSVYRALRRIKPHVIYQRVGGAHTAACAFYASVMKVPLVWHLASDMDVTPRKNQSPTNNPLHRVERMMREYGLMRATHIVAQTNQQVRLLEENYGRQADLMIRNFHPCPQETEKKRTQITVLWIANLKPLKHPELFLKVAKMCADMPSLSFEMIGRDWASDQQHQSFVEEVEQIPNLRYLGSLTNDQVNKELAQAHILVNTSDVEGFPNTFVQAWMRQVPVISLSINPDGLLDDERLGHCAEGSFNGLVEFLRNLVSDPGKRERMGRFASSFAVREFSMHNARRLADYVLQKSGGMT